MHPLIAVFAATAVATASADTALRELPGVLRQAGNVYLVENNNSTYTTMHAAGIRGATVVHLDTHDDCRFVPDTRIEKAQGLCTAGDFAAVHRQSDLEGFFRFQIRQEEMLFDLGNFLYPCIVDGTISRLYWVVPDLRVGSNETARLRRHLSVAFRVDALDKVAVHDGTGFSFDLRGARVTVTTLQGLPRLAPGAVIDLDTDFFAFPRAMTDDHLQGALQWDPEAVLKRLDERVPAPTQVVVCASVWGGYLPLTLRFIPDACFDHYATGRYPADARQLLKVVTGVRTGTGDWSALRPPAHAGMRPAYLYLRALAALEAGRVDAGRDDILAAAAQTPVYAKGLLDAAEAMAERGESEDGAAFVDRYEKHVGRQTVNSLTARAKVLAEAGALPEAEKTMRRLLEWSRSNYRLILLGGILVRDGRPEEALPLYQEALAMAPEDSALHYNYGVALVRAGRTQEAAATYRRAIQLEPTFANAWHNLGGALLEGGDTGAAIDAYQRACDLDPAQAASHLGLGTAALQSGQLALATQCLARAIALAPELAAAHATMGTAYHRLGRLDAARARWERAVELEPKDAASHNDLGNLALERGSLQAALLHYVRALEVEPEFAEAHSNLAYVFVLAGRAKEALQHSREAVRLAPRFAMGHLNHARALMMNGRHEAAAKAVARARALSPELPGLDAVMQTAPRPEGE